jgi:hypothetical protein
MKRFVAHSCFPRHRSPFVRALSVYFNANAQFCSFRRRHEAVRADVTSGIENRLSYR